MTTENLKILFVLAKNRANKVNQSPIYCRFTFKGVRKQFSTGINIESKMWNAKLQFISKKHPQALHYNHHLEELKSKVLTSMLISTSKNPTCTSDDIYNQFLGKVGTAKSTTVFFYYQQYLLKIKKLVGKELKNNTYKKFEYVAMHLEAFLKWKFKKNDIPMRELNLQFLKDFDYYLKTEKLQQQVTINKTIQRFRAPIKQAISEGFLEKDPFILYKARKVRKEVVFLSVDELQLLEGFVFKQSRLVFVRDLFIFCCYSGLPYNEMANLKWTHVQKGFDGMDWIQMTRQKTQRQISIPLLPKAKKMVDRQTPVESKIFPAISNQKFNSYLKEIAEIVGIDKKLTHHVARKTFASTVLLFNDVPMEIVSELLGHSSIVITQESYGKVVQKKISQTMHDLSAKLNGKAVHDKRLNSGE